jgi:hypothetical protein
MIIINLMFVPCIIRHSRNNQHNAQTCTTVLFVYAVSYMFRQYSVIFRGLLDPSELRENTDRYFYITQTVPEAP